MITSGLSVSNNLNLKKALIFLGLLVQMMNYTNSINGCPGLFFFFLKIPKRVLKTRTSTE